MGSFQGGRLEGFRDLQKREHTRGVGLKNGVKTVNTKPNGLRGHTNLTHPLALSIYSIASLLS